MRKKGLSLQKKSQHNLKWKADTFSQMTNWSHEPDAYI